MSTIQLINQHDPHDCHDHPDHHGQHDHHGHHDFHDHLPNHDDQDHHDQCEIWLTTLLSLTQHFWLCCVMAGRAAWQVGKKLKNKNFWDRLNNRILGEHSKQWKIPRSTSYRTNGVLIFWNVVIFIKSKGIHYGSFKMLTSFSWIAPSSVVR